MDFEFSADQELLRETVRRFLAEQAPISPYVRDQYASETGTSETVWNGLSALGVIGLLAPEASGGAGMGVVDTAVVLEEMGRAVHPGPFLSSAIGAISAVQLVGSDDDHAHWLPGLASGATIGTVAIWESDAGSSWSNPSTTATTATTDGEGWAISGRKVHVADALAADALFVVASSDAGLGVFGVRRDAAGTSVESTPTIDGSRKEGAVTFEGAPARRLGGSSDATPSVAAVVDRLIVAMVVDGVGAAARALELAVEYAKDRRQFDRAIGSFQAVQLLCADMLQYVELARAAAYYACWACDAADAAERHRATTMAKAYASDALYQVGASAVQVFGGVGFTWEHDIHLYYKRLLTLQQFAGGTTDHLEELASLVLD